MKYSSEFRSDFFFLTKPDIITYNIIFIIMICIFNFKSDYHTEKSFNLRLLIRLIDIRCEY